MKVNLESAYKTLYTLEDLEHAKALIKSERLGDNETPKGWAVYAVNEALEGKGVCYEVLKATAETMKNCRLDYDHYCEGSGFFDVWIEATAKTSNGFMECGAYLSDIHQSGAVPYSHNMWIREYKEC